MSRRGAGPLLHIAPVRFPRASAPVILSAGALALGVALASACSGGADRPARGTPPPRAASIAPAATGAPAGAAVVGEGEPSPAPLPSTPPDPFGPLSAELVKALAAIPADPAPAQITKNTHYLTSNENKPYSFRAAVAGRGGVYVGVGAEQSFLLGGWSRAELLFLMDFDEWVVDLNEIHGLVFEHARTPDELFALWGPEHREEIRAWVEERAADSAVSERRMKVYDHGRAQVHHQLKVLRARLADEQVPFFANDQAELDHVARLWRSKRVRCVRGDLTASGSLEAFGALARRAGWVVRTLYTSNAELYFDYDAGGFRDNLRALPFDDRSIVLHTQPHNKVDYLYIWQAAEPYVPWALRVRNFSGLLFEAKLPYRGKLENGAWWIEPPR